jgi:G3E family GTPase
VAERLPVCVLTGFLGSGKTTLLARLLARPELGETAVIVNELGEVAIDHHLLRRVDERTVVLASGCICCTLRGDLADELLDLLGRRERGELPAFQRVVVETTGLADPAPIVSTLVHDQVVPHHFELDRVITTVDATCGLAALEREAESQRQAAVADRLVVTKTDVAPPEDVAELEARLSAINPVAPVIEARFGECDPAELLGGAPVDPRDLEIVDAPHHPNGLRAFTVVVDEPLDWTAFGVWLTMLLQARGQDILRVKGFLDVGDEGPVLVNGVQHVVHPPAHLDTWPDDDRRSRLVFIARDVEPRLVEESLLAFSRPRS